MGTSMCVPRSRRDDRLLAYFGIPVSTLVVYEQRAVLQSTNYIPSVPILLQDIAFYWDTQQEKDYTGADKNGNSSPSAVSPDSIWIASAEKTINDFAKKSKLLSLNKRVRVEKKNGNRAEKPSGKRANRVFEKPFRSLFAKMPLRAPHFVALLTLFLRKLPEPLLPPLFVRQMEGVLSNSNMSEAAKSQALQKVDRQSFNSNYAAEHATFQYLKQLVQRHRAELIAAEVEVLVRSMLRESNECVVEFMMHQVRPLVNPVIPASARGASIENSHGNDKSNSNSSTSRSNSTSSSTSGGSTSSSSNSSNASRDSQKKTRSVSNVHMDEVPPESNEKNTSNAGSVLYSSASPHHSEAEEKKETDDKCVKPQAEESVFTGGGDSSESKKDTHEEVKRTEVELDGEEKGVVAPTRKTKTTTTTTTNATAAKETLHDAVVAPPLTTMSCAYSTESPESEAAEEEISNSNIISSIHNDNDDDGDHDHDDNNNNNNNKSNGSSSKKGLLTTEQDRETTDVVKVRPDDDGCSQAMPILRCEEKNSKKKHTSQMEEKESTRLSETRNIDSASSVEVDSKRLEAKTNKRQGTQQSEIHVAVAAAAVNNNNNNNNDLPDEYEGKKRVVSGNKSNFIKGVDRNGNYTELDMDAVLPEVNSSTGSFPKRNSFHHERDVVPVKKEKEQMNVTPGLLAEYLPQSQRKTLEFTTGSQTIQPVLSSSLYSEKETHSTVTGGRRFVEEHPRHAALLLAKQAFLGKDYLPPTKLQLDNKTSELALNSDAKDTNNDVSKAVPLFQFSGSDKPSGGIAVEEHLFDSEENTSHFPEREHQFPLQLLQQQSGEEQLRNSVIQSLLTKVEELSVQCNALAELVSSNMTPTAQPYQDQTMITKEVEKKMVILKDVVRQMAECHSSTVGDLLKLQQQVTQQQQQQLESTVAEKQSWRNDAISAKEAALELQRRCANLETAQIEGKQQLQYMSAILKDLAYKLECGEKENLDLKVEVAALQRQGLLLREKLLSSS
ncbi:uncharacterized protein TM35_000053820 [Trypanosoma theileri]|uniref:Uncharacterized protein n=1 Tax=Trypanosoma theileri TaxID=67003 RepID=A0A1X0P4C6_9TRYP|nr:uncharacterized protein TM35_000053820 [Trypanosoma theileri]ORC91786.1 hypothetical protein TM35_000053820 [Trypanosoma theileri]